MTLSQDMADLIRRLHQAGEHPAQDLLDQIKALGTATVDPLIAIALDEDLHQADSDKPEVWAPIHAIRLLGELGAADAVEPLLPLVTRDSDEWLGQALIEAFGRIGQPAMAPLHGLLFDRSRSVSARARGALIELAGPSPLAAPVPGVAALRLDTRPAGQPARDDVPPGRKVGRNEPYPCGSGKKYKKCHGR